MDFTVAADYRIKQKESEKKDKFLDLAMEMKKIMEHEGDNFTNRNWCFWYSHQRIIKENGGLGCWRTSGDHLKFNIIENGQNIEKIHGDLRRLAVTQTPVKDKTDVKKTLKK